MRTEAYIVKRNDSAKIKIYKPKRPGQGASYVESPLVYAARCGQEAVVKALLEQGDIDPNLCDELGKTPLSIAAYGGRHAIVKLLLDDDQVDPNSADEDGLTPLHWAVRYGRTSIVEILLQCEKVDASRSSKRGETPLFWAIEKKEMAIIRILLSATQEDPAMTEKNSGRTSLLRAAQSGSEDMARVLLDCGVNPNSKDIFGVTPLMWAINGGHDSTIKVLLERKEFDEDSRREARLETSSLCLEFWLKSCDQRHGSDCQGEPVQKRLPHQIPNWVIDISRGCIVPGHQTSRYVALSYAWSTKQEADTLPQAERLFLNRSSLVDFTTPGHLHGSTADRLPLLIRDTITLVQKINERYLWVDCLCIVQDDENTRSQVDHMNEVYNGAYLTIIAATSAGLFPVRKKDRKKIKRKGPSYDSHSAKDCVEKLYSQLLETRWASRAWTFQEQILSKRAAIFTDGDVFWDCQHSVWDQDNLFPAAPDDGYAAPHYATARQMSTSTWPDFRMYIELIGLYNDRNLTFPQDALPAISGVLTTLSNSFPSGFVSGLPRFFIDEALLWQPFSKAVRRAAKDGGSTTTNGYLPSWSWCGWQCAVDPFSLRTGLAYLDDEDSQSRVMSWQTSRLVQWSVLSADMQREELLHESTALSAYVHHGNTIEPELPNGWSRYVDETASSVGASKGLRFRHESVEGVRFKYPIPIEKAPRPTAMIQHGWPFLSCTTSQAFFRIASVLRPHFGVVQSALFKASVFELRKFARGPEREDICNVICLEDAQGGPAGLLRRMDDSVVTPGDEIELIATSTGSVSHEDLKYAFENRVDRTQMISYPSRSIEFWRVLPGKNETPTWDEIMENHEQRIARRMTAAAQAESEGTYHFYNVLWVERKDGIAYRRAAGRVPKEVWEKNCSEPRKIILG